MLEPKRNKILVENLIFSHGYLCRYDPLEFYAVYRLVNISQTAGLFSRKVTYYVYTIESNSFSEINGHAEACLGEDITIFSVSEMK